MAHPRKKVRIYQKLCPSIIIIRINSYFYGDANTDIDVAGQANISFILIKNSFNEKLVNTFKGKIINNFIGLL